MKFGYARVSTEDQLLDLQLDALQRYGVDRVFSEHISGANRERPELSRMMEQLREGDTVVVYKLDRLGRSMKDLVDLTEQMSSMGVDFVSLQDAVDTSTATGRLFFHVMASLAEFERDLIRERTVAGLKAARARGRSGGRPKTDPTKIDLALKMYRMGDIPIKQICETVGVSQTTLYKYVNQTSAPRA